MKSWLSVLLFSAVCQTVLAERDGISSRPRSHHHHQDPEELEDTAETKEVLQSLEKLTGELSAAEDAAKTAGEAASSWKKDTGENLMSYKEKIRDAAKEVAKTLKTAHEYVEQQVRGLPDGETVETLLDSAAVRDGDIDDSSEETTSSREMNDLDTARAPSTEGRVVEDEVLDKGNPDPSEKRKEGLGGESTDSESEGIESGTDLDRKNVIPTAELEDGYYESPIRGQNYRSHDGRRDHFHGRYPQFHDPSFDEEIPEPARPRRHAGSDSLEQHWAHRYAQYPSSYDQDIARFEASRHYPDDVPRRHQGRQIPHHQEDYPSLLEDDARNRQQADDRREWQEYPHSNSRYDASLAEHRQQLAYEENFAHMVDERGRLHRHPRRPPEQRGARASDYSDTRRASDARRLEDDFPRYSSRAFNDS